jgi:hypothetical protein
METRRGEVRKGDTHVCNEGGMPIIEDVYKGNDVM